MTIDEHINHWLNSAIHDLDTAETLLKAKKYDWALFIGYLVLEKTLKALFVMNNNNKIPPKIHNLVRLSERAGIELTEQQKIFLDKVNDFNLEVRYPEFKDEFYLTITKEFAEDYFVKIRDFYQWLRSLIK